MYVYTAIKLYYTTIYRCIDENTTLMITNEQSLSHTHTHWLKSTGCLRQLSEQCVPKGLTISFFMSVLETRLEMQQTAIVFLYFRWNGYRLFSRLRVCMCVSLSPFPLFLSLSLSPSTGRKHRASLRLDNASNPSPVSG